MHRFDVLSRETAILGPHFLEASAGTGKTFAIEHVALRLLLDGVPLDQILIVTFTRAATRELKMRIRANVEKGLQILKGEQESEWDYLQAIVDKEEGIRKLEEALFYFDRAQIFTIHGFCHRMLTECAFEAGQGWIVTDPDSSEFRSKIKPFIADFLRSRVDASEYSPRQLEKVVKDWDKLISKIAYFLGQNGELPQLPTFSESHTQFLAQLPSVKREDFLAEFAKLSPCYKGMTDEAFPRQVALLGNILEAGHCSAAEFDELLADATFFLSKMRVDNLKVKAKLPSDLGIFPRLQETLLPIIEQAKDPASTLIRLSRSCQIAFQHAQDAASPDFLLKKMHTAVQNPSFADAVRARYSAAIIDEFQDTDPIQWEIFRDLFVNHNMTALYLVGDPKQSIYAFRSADVYTYLEAKERFGETACFSLDTNFRSSTTLVQSLNTLFSREFAKEWLHLPSLGQSLEYPPVKAVKTSDETAPPLHFFIASVESGRERSWPSITHEETLFFPFIAQEIQRLNKPFSEYAVLIKDRFQAQRLHQFLKKWGIPSAIQRTESLSQSPAFPLIQSLLEALIHPRDLSLIKQVLGGPLFGWDDAKLQEDLEVLEMRSWFAALASRFKSEGFSAVFRELTVEDSSLYCDLRQLAEIVMEHQLQTQASADDLLAFLKELKQADPEEDHRLKKRQPDGESQVIIMTTHMSKGLEFGVVFALSLIARHAVQEDWVRERDGKLVPFDPSSPACIRALQEKDAEKMRQLYVALTRAKQLLYIPVLFDKKQKAPAAGAASPMELFCAQLQTHSFEELIPVLENMKQQCAVTYTDLGSADLTLTVMQQNKQEIPLPPLILPAPFEKRMITSFSSLARVHQVDRLQMPSTSEKTPHTLPLGAYTGTVLHRILEIAIGKPHVPLEQIVSRETRSTSLEEWKEVITPLLTDILAMIDLRDARVQQEVEFLFPAGQSMIKGFADLVFEKEGIYYLLDWKSNWLGPSDEHYTTENIEKAMHEHDYFLQASIYATALGRYLKLFDPRPFEECFGGALYVFLRGKALYHFTPESLMSKT
jgi:exodeoxyribonuclease V beta subunit